MCPVQGLSSRQFLSTPSARRATRAFCFCFFRTGFLSTPSARRATPVPCRVRQGGSISIHALREEGDCCACTPRRAIIISIHALREEGDKHTGIYFTGRADFYPRPPRGGRLSRCHGTHRLSGFLSTPSARRATKSVHFAPPHSLFLSTPSARRATRHRRSGRFPNRDFYPRPPRGGRPALRKHSFKPLRFLSTPSARRATGKKRWNSSHNLISIHALREEGDVAPIMETFVFALISIHALREEGDFIFFVVRVGQRKFLSTPSARRATYLY